jgi:tetratricopeptide (TPR) repeat protein
VTLRGVSELMRLAQGRDVDAVLGTFRSYGRDEVLAVADWLREEDIYRVAIELYRWLLDEADSAAANFGIGQCHGKIYDFDTALKYLDRAFAEEPERSEGASYYAYVLERHERMDEADRWYRVALAGAEADDLWAHSHYAWFLEKWGRTDAAVRTYQDVLERNPGYTWAVKRYALLLRRLGEGRRAWLLLKETAERTPGNKFAALNYLEYLLLTEDGEYPEFRASLELAGGPVWYPVVVEMYDYFRDHLLSGTSDPGRLAAWHESADALTDSVHRDFEDLTALLTERDGDLNVWRGQVAALLK